MGYLMFVFVFALFKNTDLDELQPRGLQRTSPP